MQISNVSNTNFGRIYLRDIAINEGVNLSGRDRRLVKELVGALNTGAARDISVYAQIGKPEVMAGRKAIRVLTSPTPSDMAVIKAFRPQAERRDYKRRSHWVRLYDKDVYDKLAVFIHGQKGFIHHCTVDPHHNSRPFDTPFWQPGEDKGAKYAKRRFIGDF